MYPVKNLTWIAIEIPCHFMSQIDGSLDLKSIPNSMTIPCHLCRFYLFSLLKHMTWISDKFKSWNFHGIFYKNDGISIGFGLIFDQTENDEKIHVTFFTGYTSFIENTGYVHM